MNTPTEGTRIAYFNSGSSSKSGFGPCPKGYVCATLSSVPVLCKQRHYCPRSGLKDSQELKCKPGTFNPYQGKSACIKCPVGFYCPEEGMYMPKQCPK